MLYLRAKTSSAPKEAVFKKALFGSVFKNYSNFCSPFKTLGFTYNFGCLSLFGFKILVCQISWLVIRKAPNKLGHLVTCILTDQPTFFNQYQLLQPGMLMYQFVLTYLCDFFWMVYHISDRDQIMGSQTPCNNFQALQMVSSLFHFQF